MWAEMLTAPSAARDRAVRDRHLALRARRGLRRARAARSRRRRNRRARHDQWRTRRFGRRSRTRRFWRNLQIASRIVGGELAARRGQSDRAVALLEEAVALEDAIPYNEPPVWHHPVRQILGGVLLDAGRAQRGRGGLSRGSRACARERLVAVRTDAQPRGAAGHRDAAPTVRRRFERAWKRADITLTSSRIIADDRRRAADEARLDDRARRTASRCRTSSKGDPTGSAGGAAARHHRLVAIVRARDAASAAVAPGDRHLASVATATPPSRRRATIPRDFAADVAAVHGRAASCGAPSSSAIRWARATRCASRPIIPSAQRRSC